MVVVMLDVAGLVVLVPHREADMFCEAFVFASQRDDPTRRVCVDAAVSLCHSKLIMNLTFRNSTPGGLCPEPLFMGSRRCRRAPVALYDWGAEEQ